jgi:hypothetical protein
MAKQKNALVTAPLESLIAVIRGERVIFDSDLARLYGVTTKRFNEAFKRNRDRFPEDFAFRLSKEEWESLQIVPGTRNRSQFATGSQKHRDPRYLPWVFTEHGALMAANVLRSQRATEMSLFVIRAFVKLRQHTAANAAILKRLAEIDQTLLVHDHELRDLYHKLMPLLQPEPLPQKPRIGFRTKEE